jgi:hypothetical protein
MSGRDPLGWLRRTEQVRRIEVLRVSAVIAVLTGGAGAG